MPRVSDSYNIAQNVQMCTEQGPLYEFNGTETVQRNEEGLETEISVKVLNPWPAVGGNTSFVIILFCFVSIIEYGRKTFICKIGSK